MTVLTDFGLTDPYVGQVKGAILGVAPGAQVVDLTHAVPPQDVTSGAFLLWSAVEVFPPGTVHLAVVDPGVGSARRAIALQARRGDRMVGPDNGLLLPAAERLGGPVRVVELSEPRYWRQAQPSGTFHGRDIFGPVAGHLAAGLALEHLGPPVVDPLRLALPAPHGLDGEVMHVDTYGNLVTNLPAEALPARYRVRLGDHVIEPRPHYAAAAPGALLALVGSAGLLELSAREASAATLTGATRGTRVQIEPA